MEIYRARSNGQERPVLVLHAWWGLNDDVRRFGDDLGRAGHPAHAPDLYGGRRTQDPKQAETLRKGMDRKELNDDLVSSLDGLLAETSAERVGVVGFSVGASWAVSLAKYRPHQVDKVVLYYGKGTGSLDRITDTTFLAHLAESDPNVKNFAGFRKNLEAEGLTLEEYSYPGTTHWFAEPSVSDAFDEQAAGLAFRRTLEFLA